MAKRILAIVVAVIMVIGTCAVAASALGTYQAKINNGETEITLTSDTRETLTINSGDVTIDLNGYELKSEYGKSAIIVNGGNVTVRNGRVTSFFAQVKSADMLQTVFTKSPSGIRVNGGSLTVEGVRVVGSMARVPTTTDYFVPSGSAIMTKNGAEVTLRQATLIGDYGVNNKVTGSTPGGNVYIEDAIILAYNTFIKDASKEVVDETVTDKVNAADRIEGFLNDGITLEARERKLIRDMLDQRAYVYTKKVPADKIGTIQYAQGDQFATVIADEISYEWENTTSTDCSYKLVPAGVKFSDGKIADLDKVDTAKLDNKAQIVYRVDFKACNKTNEDVWSYLENFDNYVDLAWWANYIEEGYEWMEDNSGKGIDSYEEVMKELGAVLKMIDDLGSANIDLPGGGKAFAYDIAEYRTLRQKIFAIGGAVVYNHGDRDFEILENGKCGPNQYRTYNGLDENAPVPENYMYGTLDRVEKLRVELREICPDFKDTSKWADAIIWAYDNYEEVIDIARDLIDQLADLKTTLDGDMYQRILNQSEQIKDKLGLIDKAIEYGNLIIDAIDEALAYPDVSAAIDAIEANKSQLKGDINKVIGILKDYRTYFTPENFFVDGYVKGYRTLGKAVIDVLQPNKKLVVNISGDGVAQVKIDGAAADDAEPNNANNYEFEDSFTVTAVPEEDWEFLFWANEETDRIYTTEPTINMTTSMSRELTAYFQPTDEPAAYFVSATGSLCSGAVKLVNGQVTIPSTVKNAYITGYVFTGWTGAQNGVISAQTIAEADKTAYFSGSSAFAVPNAYYTGEGAILAPNSASTSGSILVLPLYTADGEYTVYFNDNGEKFFATGKFGNIATITASGENFSYWKDRAGNIVCLTPEFNCSLVREDTYTAVYGDDTALPDYVMKVSYITKGDRVPFIFERSVAPAYSGKILSSGLVYSYTNPNPTDGGADCSKGLMKSTADNGAYILNFRQDRIAERGGKVYVRAYIEIDGIGLRYSDEVYTYPG